MSYNSEDSVFTTIGEFFASTEKSEAKSNARIIHCINSFPAEPGTEHHKAQRVTFASMTRARMVAQLLCPNVKILFAKVTSEEDETTSLIEFDVDAKLDRTVLDLKSFRTPRPLPLVMDVITAIDIEPQDIFVFTNVDVALVPDFYAFIYSLFERGADCAIINRRTISDVYGDERDLSLMTSEAGAPHPGFDCFAFLGSLRNNLIRYDSCIGIGGVMLPLVHQLLATAHKPVVLLDAHATFHLGDDRRWRSDKFADYAEHNRNEVDHVFKALLRDVGKRERLLGRLKGAPRKMAFPQRLRGLSGTDEKPMARQNTTFLQGLRSKVRSLMLG